MDLNILLFIFNVVTSEYFVGSNTSISCLYFIIFAISPISNTSSKGVKRLLEIIKSKDSKDDEEFINLCLDSLGYIQISDRSQKIISEHLKINKYENDEDKIMDVLKIIVSTPDFQYC